MAQAPGADDNASGTAAVLEMARVMQSVGYRPKITVRFSAFAAEKLSLLGSQHYAGVAWQNARKIIHMQNYDMIGYLDPGDMLRQVRIIWYVGARDIAEQDSAIMRTYTTLTPVLSTSYRSQSDSWYFSVQGYKAFFNIENTFNPFNPTTVIRYHLPVAGSVRLAVYDPLGREAALLVNEVKGPGSYTATWNARGIAGGVYFCRLTTGDAAEVKRMLLLR